jgi:hypothetical protein
MSLNCAAKEWLGLGIWTRREEARKSWFNFRTDEVVYVYDFFPREFKRNGTARIEWISKYKHGHIWLEYHGLLHGKRPTQFYAIVEFALNESKRLSIDACKGRPRGRGSVFVDIAKFIQLPEGVIPKGVSSIVRLKLFDDGDGFARHIPDELLESLFGFRASVGVNREHDIPRWVGVPEQSQMPCQLIETRSKTVDHVREAEVHIGVNEIDNTSSDVPLINQVVFLGDCIWLRPTELHDKRSEFLDVFIRPTNLRFQIAKPAPACV